MPSRVNNKKRRAIERRRQRGIPQVPVARCETGVTPPSAGPVCYCCEWLPPSARLPWSGPGDSSGSTGEFPHLDEYQNWGRFANACGAEGFYDIELVGGIDLHAAPPACLTPVEYEGLMVFAKFAYPLYREAEEPNTDFARRVRETNAESRRSLEKNLQDCPPEDAAFIRAMCQAEAQFTLSNVVSAMFRDAYPQYRKSRHGLPRP